MPELKRDNPPDVEACKKLEYMFQAFGCIEIIRCNDKDNRFEDGKYSKYHVNAYITPTDVYPATGKTLFDCFNSVIQQANTKAEELARGSDEAPPA